jgi:type II secretory pathway pseudopilin PulG
MIVKAKRSGLTMVEILVVVGIISLLVGLLLPAISKVKSMAREAKQKVQFTAIGLGLATFKNDYGDYPPSDYNSWLDDTATPNTSSGAQKLCEALLGYDLLGFHPDSGWRVDGTNRRPYDDGTTTHASGSYYLYERNSIPDMDKRKGRYIDLDSANVARLGMGTGRDGVVHDGLFDLSSSGGYAAGIDTFVIGDVFGKGKEIILDGVKRKTGLPVLYYRANTSGKWSRTIYDFTDNDALVYIKEQADLVRKGTPAPGTVWNPLSSNQDVFYNRIRDPRASTSAFDVPHKPDSYILISAGADGFYGTRDDIYNFPTK